MMANLFDAVHANSQSPFFCEMVCNTLPTLKLHREITLVDPDSNRSPSKGWNSSLTIGSSGCPHSSFECFGLSRFAVEESRLQRAMPPSLWPTASNVESPWQQQDIKFKFTLRSSTLHLPIFGDHAKVSTFAGCDSFAKLAKLSLSRVDQNVTLWIALSEIEENPAKIWLFGLADSRLQAP